MASEAEAAAKAAADAIREKAVEAAILSVRQSRLSQSPVTPFGAGLPIGRPRLAIEAGNPAQTDQPAARSRESSARRSRREANDGASSISSSRSSIEEVLERLVTYNLRSNMPKVEVEPFDGDYTKYRAFVKTFDATVSSRASDDEEKLLYLIQYTRGVPNDVVKACVHMPSGGYAHARKLLDKCYGRNTEKMNSYVEQILSYPTIKAGDIDGLDRFSLLLTNAGNVMLAVKPGAREMENTKTIRQIVAKLPFNLQERFRRLVDRSHDEEVSFQTLVDFPTEEVRIASHPIFGTKHLKADRQETHASGSGDKPKAGNDNKGKRAAATKQEWCKGRKFRIMWSLL